MELDWLEDFLALVESGNFSRAAEIRNLTQPAFSRRIKSLEDWAGAALFDRSTHRIGLTVAGEAFCRPAEEIVRRIQQSREELRKVAGSAASTLRFAATHALSLTFFPTWLREIEARVPQAGIQLMSDTMKACEQALRQGQAQFLLCHSHAAVPARLDGLSFVSVCVGEDVLAPVSAPGEHGLPLYHLPADPGTTLPLLAYSPESALGWIVDAATAGKRDGQAFEVVVTAHLATVLRALARDGRGITWLPLSLVQSDLDNGILVRAGEADWDAKAEIRLFRPKSRLTSDAEAFWRLIQR